MSSRVRMVLQDFGNNMSWTGKSAVLSLEALYKNWLAMPKAINKGLPWQRVDEQEAALHPSRTVYLARPPADYCLWVGEGHYQKLPQPAPPAGPVGPLPEGPKWLRLLEMWERLQPTHKDRYNFLISRDNKKQSWRHSLCNPFVQGWGYKIALKVKKVPKKSRNVTVGRTVGEILERNWDFGERAVGQVPVPGRRSTAKETRPNPRVGIWQ